MKLIAQSQLGGLTHPRVRLEGGVCVMTDVSEGMVGCMASKPRCRGREPGRTMVGVGAELLGGVSWENSTEVNPKDTVPKHFLIVDLLFKMKKQGL